MQHHPKQEGRKVIVDICFCLPFTPPSRDPFPFSPTLTIFICAERGLLPFFSPARWECISGFAGPLACPSHCGRCRNGPMRQAASLLSPPWNFFLVGDLLRDLFRAELARCEFYAPHSYLSCQICEGLLREAEPGEDIYHWGFIEGMWPLAVVRMVRHSVRLFFLCLVQEPDTCRVACQEGRWTEVGEARIH